MPLLFDRDLSVFIRIVKTCEVDGILCVFVIHTSLFELPVCIFFPFFVSCIFVAVDLKDVCVYYVCV